MSGTRWCRGVCVSGLGPVVELSGCLSYPLPCNRGLRVSSLHAYHCVLSGGPHCRSGCWQDSMGEEPASKCIAAFVCELRVAMNI